MPHTENKNGTVKKLKIGTYFYDGEGRRVKKFTDQKTTIFAYSSGKILKPIKEKGPCDNFHATPNLLVHPA